MKKEHCCENKPGDKLYKIGMFAAMNHVTIKALRYYDEQGLLKPVYVDTAITRQGSCRSCIRFWPCVAWAFLWKR